MNREILFRGKVKLPNRYRGYNLSHRNGDWVYGLMNSNESIRGIFVDVNTIGQYTGLTDKNGTKIFEGDIITFEDVCCEGGSGYEYPDEWAVEAMNRAEIIIRNGCVCFGKELFETSAYEDIQSYYPNLNEWFAECAEVIGNIHDNPELVKA